MKKGTRTAALAYLTLFALAACGSPTNDAATPDDNPRGSGGGLPEAEPGITDTTEAPRRPSQTPTPPSAGADNRPSPDADNLRLRLLISGQQFEAELDDSAAAGDLLALLPLTVDMTDHGGVEKTGPLPSPLSLDGQPEAADPDVGDLGYYAPGNDLVLYYGDQSYYPGIVVLGRMTGDAPDRLATLDGPVTADVSVAE